MTAASYCDECGGHGATIRTVTTEAPGLTAVMRKRLTQGRPATLAVPCTSCDGDDHATPHLEQTAEMQEDQ